MIDHTQDVPADESQELPGDTPEHASIPTRLVKKGGPRQPAEATIMLSLRVKPALKKRFEQHSQNGTLTNPEILEHLLDLAERGEVVRHQEVMQELAALKTQQVGLISYVSELRLFDVTKDLGTMVPSDEDPFAHRDPATWGPAPDPSPVLPIVKPKRWRFFGGRS